MSYVIKLSLPLLLLLSLLAIAVATENVATGITLTSTTRMGDRLLQKIQNYNQDANDVVLLPSHTRSASIRSTKKRNQLVQHNNRILQQQESSSSCSICTGNLYEVNCSSGRVIYGNNNGRYMFQNSNNTTCYDQVCCSSNDGEDCCIDNDKNSINGIVSVTNSPTKAPSKYDHLGNSPTKAPSGYDRLTCPNNFTVWDVAYCKYGKNTSNFGTHSGFGEFLPRLNAYDTCCAKTIDECCLPNPEIDVVIYNTSPGGTIVSPEPKLSVGTILGIVVGIICIIVLTSALVVIYWYQRKGKQGEMSAAGYDTSIETNKTTGHTHPTAAINGDSKCGSNILNQSMGSFQSSALQSGVPAQPQQQLQQQQQQQQQQQPQHQQLQQQTPQQQPQQQPQQFDLNVSIPTTVMDDMSAITYEPFSTYQSHFPIVTDCEPCVDGSVIYDNDNQTTGPKPFIPPTARC